MPKFDFSRHALPTPYERELLTILMEECAEVQQRASKMLRFGSEEIQPGQELTNAQRLTDEIGDIYALVQLLERRGIVDPMAIAYRIDAKKVKLKQFMQHEPD